MKKFLNYNFLVTVLASVIVFLEVLMKIFNIYINIDAVISISLAIIGILVTIGIVTKNKTDKTIETKEDLKQLLEEKKQEASSENIGASNENEENIKTDLN